MNKEQAVKKKAEWLAYCLEIGFPKSDLDELDAIWDRFKDENGNLRKSQPDTTGKEPAGSLGGRGKKMKLEDQVVSLELSKKISELGVNVSSLFYHTLAADTSWWIHYGELKLTPQYPAYTVAELGVMLGKYWEQEIRSAYPFDSGTEAEERAHYLIGAIESGQLTIDQVNNSLNQIK